MVTGEAPRSTDGFRLTGTVFEGRFEIEREIAEGGFAVVYRARHLALDRPVALKVLKAPRGPGESSRAEFQARFAAEAKTIARLKHPHIVDVYDFAIGLMPNGESAPWMALEWLDGETLATQLLRRRRDKLAGLPPREALNLFRPVVQALAFAHEQGIVHRDIKPANIMVVRGDPGPSLRVLDFGIAKIVDADRPAGSGDTRTDSVPAFTPSYAAPEQVAYSRTGAWTDVHALGLILTELLTGVPPYAEAEAEAHLFEQVMSVERPTPSSKGVDVGPFEPIVAKAIALSPRERWADAGALLKALEAAELTGQPTLRMAGSAPLAAAAPHRAPAAPGLRRTRIAAIAIVGVAALAALAARRGHPPVAPAPAAFAPGPAPSGPRPRPAASQTLAAGPVAPPAPTPRPIIEPPRSVHRLPHARRAAAHSANASPPVNDTREVEPKDLFDDPK